jgi:hypothetical protein
MNKARTKFVLPVYVIVLGLSLYLNSLDVVPGVNWVWPASMATVGLLTFLVWGVNKLSVVVGPFLVIASICSFLSQVKLLQRSSEISLLVMALGVLLLIVQVLKLPSPDFLGSSGGAE